MATNKNYNTTNKTIKPKLKEKNHGASEKLNLD